MHAGMSAFGISQCARQHRKFGGIVSGTHDGDHDGCTTSSKQSYGPRISLETTISSEHYQCSKRMEMYTMNNSNAAYKA